MELMTETEVAYWAARYRSAHGQATLQYAMRTALDYADVHAGKAPAAIREGVARLHLRHCLSRDSGERALMRIAIDALLGIGGAR